MPSITVPGVVFRRLSERAAALNLSIDDHVEPTLAFLAEYGSPPPKVSLRLTGEAWKADREAWNRDAEAIAGRYPPGFVLDDSRETMYRERLDAQL